jgi:trehalose-phosphatase
MIEICIASGRSLAEIKRMVGLKNLLYVGNHGLEIEEIDGVNTLPQAPRLKRRIKSICDRLKTFSQRFPGFWVENKGLTASLHYRLVPLRLSEKLTEEISAWLKDNASGLRVTQGRKVWELRPQTNRDKGWAVEHISGRFQVPEKLEIYAGDDRTDWDAFKIIRKRQGIAVQVGTKGASSKHCFYLKSPGELTLLMEKLATLLRRLNSKEGKLTRRIYARES